MSFDPATLFLALFISAVGVGLLVALWLAVRMGW